MPGPSVTDDFAWLSSFNPSTANRIREDLMAIFTSGVPTDLFQSLLHQLSHEIVALDAPDEAVHHLRRFIDASRSPISLIGLFEREPAALSSLLKMFAISQPLANRLIADPACFDLLRASDGRPSTRRYLIDELTAELSHRADIERASAAVADFVRREHLRIAYSELVRGLPADRVGVQLAYVADAVVQGALAYCIHHLLENLPQPRQLNGDVPQVIIIGLGALGGEEMGYSTPLKLVFLYDSIDEKNPFQREFYERFVKGVCEIVQGSSESTPIYEVDLHLSPKIDSGISICSVQEALQILEKTGQTWHRLEWIKARVVAGSISLGEEFTRQLETWIYRRYLSRSELSDVRALRHKLIRRTDESHSTNDITRQPGGRHDVELTVAFLQLLHGNDGSDVYHHQTLEAIASLERKGTLTTQEASLLSTHYIKLCRAEHESSLSEHPYSVTQERELADTLAINRRIISHLLQDGPQNDDAIPDATELMLDPEPEPSRVAAVLAPYGFADPSRAMEDLMHLGTEATPYLSLRRCRHFLSQVAPALLQELSQTPQPHAALATLVRVTDSIGAKSVLWELFGTHPPTMQLMVRICAAAPYLSNILVNHPGMIDELIDSLLMNRLPSRDRLDAQSIELCRGAMDIERNLHSFKNAAHLTIGVRDILAKEPISAIHAALSDTADACLRRIVDVEQERLGEQLGDPVTPSGEPAEFIVIALGKLGGREPNYHSDLEIVCLYEAEGETKRRVGGHRKTTSNHHFFSQLTRALVTHVNQVTSGGRLFELESRLRTGTDEGTLAMTIDDYLKRFLQGTATLSQRLALCKARVITGSRHQRQSVLTRIHETLAARPWDRSTADEIRGLRRRMEQSATVDNLKRGPGGTVDVELIAQTLSLKAVREKPDVIRSGTLEALDALANCGALDRQWATALANNYCWIRRVEASLRLMNTTARHELPEDTPSLQLLSYLLNEPEPEAIVRRCNEARQSNRKIFDAVFEQLAVKLP